MKKAAILTFLLLTVFASESLAFWIWTPETRKWVNPKYSVKETPQAQFQHAMDLYKAGDPDKALKEFHNLLKHYPKAREAADAQFFIAEVQEYQGNLMQAFKDYQLTLDKYPFTQRAEQIVERQFGIAKKMMNGDRKWFQSDYDVVEILRAVISNAPYGPYASEAQYKIGLYLQEKKLLQEARDEFEKTMNDYPGTEWARAAKYQIGVSDAKRSAGPQYNQEVTKSAIEEFEEFVEKYPDAELSQEAKDRIGNLREKEAESQFVVAEFYEKQEKFDAIWDYQTSPLYADAERAALDVAVGAGCVPNRRTIPQYCLGQEISQTDPRPERKKQIMKRFFLSFLVIGCMFIIGCGYTTKSALPPRLQTIYVKPFENKIDFTTSSRRTVYFPLLEIKARDALIDRYQFDGNLKLVDSEAAADLILEVSLESYVRQALRYTDDDDVQEFRVNVIVDMSLYDTGKGEYMWEENSFAGEATFFREGAKATSEELAVEEAVLDLARRIVERTIEDG